MKTPVELEAIMAIADNGAFGIHQGLPWHIPSELQYFKSITMNNPMIMGYNTFKSIGNLLPGRDHIVITSKKFQHKKPFILLILFRKLALYYKHYIVRKLLLLGVQHYLQIH